MDPSTYRIFSSTSGYLSNPTISLTGYGIGGGDCASSPSVQLTWDSQELSNLTINQGIGAVANSGTLRVYNSYITLTFTITGTTADGGTLTSSFEHSFGGLSECTRQCQREARC